VSTSYQWRFGNISGTLPLEVEINGQSALPVSAVNADYTPAVDDMVLIMQNETDVIVVCQIISGG
jgi:hypothetical protein